MRLAKSGLPLITPSLNIMLPHHASGTAAGIAAAPADHAIATIASISFVFLIGPSVCRGPETLEMAVAN